MGGIMKKSIITILALLFLSTNIYAEPTPSIRYFMNESVSLFDFGMYLVNKDIDKLCSNQVDNYLKNKGCDINKAVLGNSRTKVYYEWDKNRILFWTWIFNVMPNMKQTEFKEVCEQLIGAIRGKFGIIEGKVSNKANNSHLGNYFKHYDYKTSEKKNYFNELDNITKIIIDTDYYRAVTPLIGTEKDILYSKK